MNHAEQAMATVGAPNAPVTPAETPRPVPTRTESVTVDPPQAAARKPASTTAPQPIVTTTAAPATSAPASTVSNQPSNNPPSAPPATPPLQPIVPPVVIPASAPPPPPVSDVPPVSAQTASVDPAITPAVPVTRLEELTLAADSVIGIRLESTVSSQTAHVEDKVGAVVTRDVTVAGHTAIAAGTKLEGVVQSVESGGKFKNQARVGLRFTRLVLADNTKVAIQTETIFREGEPPTNEAVSKVGASTVVGSILGALIGGRKGAAIGAGAGAAGGAAAVAAGDPNAVIIMSGTLMTVRLTSPITISVDRHD